MIFFIVLLALWTSPIIGLALVLSTRKNPVVRKLMLMFFASVIIIVTGGLITGISTTSPIADWILLSLIYLAASFLLWIPVFKKNIYVKAISVVVIAFAFGIGYLSGTVGILGVGFIVSAYEPSAEVKLDKNIIYKETGIGNAISDTRGKRVEIYKTISWFPLFEWKVIGKDYYNLITYINKLDVRYDKEDKIIYLSVKDYDQQLNKPVYWSDSLVVGQ